MSDRPLLTQEEQARLWRECHLSPEAADALDSKLSGPVLPGEMERLEKAIEEAAMECAFLDDLDPPIRPEPDDDIGWLAAHGWPRGKNVHTCDNIGTWCRMCEREELETNQRHDDAHLR